MTLKRTDDRKVTNSVTAKGNSRIANAFSLPSGKAYSCPRATDYCESICYAGKLEKMYPSFKRLVLHNFNELQGLDKFGMSVLLIDMLTEFVKECDRKNAPKLFRIHADGDFFNRAYVDAWTMTMSLFPEVKFWAYTRVLEACIALHKADLSNLSLYFSADRDNIAAARHLNEKYGILVAVVDDTFAEAKALFPAFSCPENRKSIELISPKGSACVRCGICIDGRKSVAFSKTKG